MKNYKILLFDLDDTLLDFGAAEQTALQHVLDHHGVSPAPELFENYKRINQQHWEMLERNELTRGEVLSKRHEVFFDTLGLKVDGGTVDEIYRTQIGAHGHQLFEGALEVLRILSKTHRIFIITNGVKITQEKRLGSSGILPYFEGVFISEDTGFQKPLKAFFDHVAEHIDSFNPEEALIIGDSLTSDILGGVNSGIDTCWYNPGSRENPFDFNPLYEIKELNEIFHITGR